MTERTLVLIKPDGVQRQLTGRILARYEDRGLKVVGLNLVHVERATAEAHYDAHRAKPFFGGLVDASMDRLVDMLTPRELPAGQVVFREGDKGCSMYVVECGELLVCRCGSSGLQVRLKDSGEWIDAIAPEGGAIINTGLMLEVVTNGVIEPDAEQRTAEGRDAGHREAEHRDAEDTASGPRQVRLTVARVDPWSVLKLSFLLSVALGVALVVAVAVLWSVLSGMGVFADVEGVVGQVVGDESSFDLMEVIGLSRVLSLTVVVAVVDVVLLTLLATLGAVLYNICSALVGGARLTLTDD